MFTTGPNRIDGNIARGGRTTRNGSESLPDGLALSQIVAGVMENWEEIEQQLPWNRPPQSDQEPVRQQAVQASQSQRPVRNEGKRRSHEVENTSALAESEDLPLLGQPLVKTAKEVKEEARPKALEAPAAETQQALAWRAPELPKVDGAAASAAATYPVPNHSAGASGFGNTWSHVAKSAQPDSIVHSE
ncbi:hypothetical protein IV102_08875 [bacterium]|nr:hypothetical protein [bacterium]